MPKYVMATKVRFTEESVKKYLDHAIGYWRQKHDDGDELAIIYVDAYQSVRASLFGDILPREDDNA